MRYFLAGRQQSSGTRLQATGPLFPIQASRDMGPLPLAGQDHGGA